MQQNPDRKDLYFTVASCECKHVFNLGDVVRFEASSNYTIIHSLNRRPLVVAKVLRLFEPQLAGADFIRTHRSHLVNKRHIVEIDAQGNLVLFDRSTVEVSRRRKKEVLASLRPCA